MKHTQKTKDRLFGMWIGVAVTAAVCGGIVFTLIVLGIITVPSWR